MLLATGRPRRSPQDPQEEGRPAHEVPRPLDSLLWGVLCDALLGLGIASPARTWQKWVGLVIGVAGLAGVGVITLHGRWR